MSIPLIQKIEHNKELKVYMVSGVGKKIGKKWKNQIKMIKAFFEILFTVK